MAPVIVFGPTGNVGSVTAQTAANLGAKVILAMRDTSKSIPRLDEKAGNFERVQADLSNPESLTAAVKTSGATRAFVYLAHRSGDHMKSAFEALKSAGIEFIIFLSSFTCGHAEKLTDFPPTDFIAYNHAQVELQLEAVFGISNFVALRPGAFATNITRYKAAINAGEGEQFGQSFAADCVTPEDMGGVAGNVLVNGPKNDQHIIYIYGAKVLTQGDATRIASRVVTGKDIKLGEQSKEAFIEQGTKMFGSRPMAEYMARAYEEMATFTVEKAFPHYDEGLQNVRNYTGRDAMQFEDWVRANKHLFAV